MADRAKSIKLLPQNRSERSPDAKNIIHNAQQAPRVSEWQLNCSECQILDSVKKFTEILKIMSANLCANVPSKASGTENSFFWGGDFQTSLFFFSSLNQYFYMRFFSTSQTRLPLSNEILFHYIHNRIVFKNIDSSQTLHFEVSRNSIYFGTIQE